MRFRDQILTNVIVDTTTTTTATCMFQYVLRPQSQGGISVAVLFHNYIYRIALNFRGSKFFANSGFIEIILRICYTRTLHATCQKFSLKYYCEFAKLKTHENLVLYGIYQLIKLTSSMSRRQYSCVQLTVGRNTTYNPHTVREECVYMYVASHQIYFFHEWTILCLSTIKCRQTKHTCTTHTQTRVSYRGVGALEFLPPRQNFRPPQILKLSMVIIVASMCCLESLSQIASEAI